MKKIIVTIGMCLTMVLSLTACGKSNDFGVTLSEYKNIVIPQSDIDNEITLIREYFSEEAETISEGVVKEGDTIDISYVGKVDGVAFEGGTAENQKIKVGASGYIDGFDQGLTGKEIGSTFDLEVTFPEDYQSTELAGKDAVFTTTINHLEKIILPDYTDEWVATVSGDILGETVSTTEEFEENIFEYLVITKLFEESTLDSYDEETFDAMMKDQNSYYEEYAATQGMDLETLLSLYGMSTDTIENDVKENLKWQSIIFEIASLENIEADEEYEEVLSAEAKEAGYDSTDEYIEKETIANYYLEYTKAYALYPKIVDLVMSTATISE